MAGNLIKSLDTLSSNSPTRRNLRRHTMYVHICLSHYLIF